MCVFVYTKVITVISSNASLLSSGLAHSVNAMIVSNDAPTGLRQPVLPTACWRARVTSSVVAVDRLFFIEYKKKFPCAHATHAANSFVKLASLGAVIVLRA